MRKKRNSVTWASVPAEREEELIKAYGWETVMEAISVVLHRSNRGEVIEDYEHEVLLVLEAFKKGTLPRKSIWE